MTLYTLLLIGGIAIGFWALVILALQWPWSRRAPLRLDTHGDVAALPSAGRALRRAPRGHVTPAVSGPLLRA